MSLGKTVGVFYSYLAESTISKLSSNQNMINFTISRAATGLSKTFQSFRGGFQFILRRTLENRLTKVSGKRVVTGRKLAKSRYLKKRLKPLCMTISGEKYLNPPIRILSLIRRDWNPKHLFSKPRRLKWIQKRRLEQRTR